MNTTPPLASFRSPASMADRLRGGAVLLATLAAPGLARAQCNLAWVAESASIGASSEVRTATTWDPDGPGPATARLVLGGGFAHVVDTVTGGIAAWDPTSAQWSNCGGGVDGMITSVVATTTGTLVATGTFGLAGGVPAPGLARWNGSAWAPLGLGVTADRLLALANGDVLAVRNLTFGGLPIATIERWNGSTWSTLATGFMGRILALAEMANGDVVAAGEAIQGGGVAAHIARWNGTTWTPLGSGLGGPGSTDVRALAVLQNGDLVAGGTFTTAGGLPAERVARWDGANWSALGAGVTSGLTAAVHSLCVHGNGDLFVGGIFTAAGGLPADNVAKWSNGAWSAVGTGIVGRVDALTPMPNGDIVAAGAFTNLPSGVANHVARWDGTTWQRFTGSTLPPDGMVQASAELDDGSLVLGGAFTSFAGIAANRIVRRSGSTWQPLGAGVDGFVTTILPLGNGELIAGGLFTQAGGAPASRIARWNGTAWSALGSGLGGMVSALARMPNGDIVAGGSFVSAGGVPAQFLARWNGTTWAPLGNGTQWPVSSLALRPDGTLAVASSSPSVQLGRVELWNGTTLSLLGGALYGRVNFVRTLANGDLLAGGSFLSLNIASPGLVRWNGATWSGFGLATGSEVLATAELPDGDVVAAGSLIVGATAHTMLRRDGAAWQTLGAPTGAFAPRPASLTALAQGDMAIGGSFSTMGGVVSPRFVTLRTPCPATATPFGTGCSGTGGANALVPTALPWLGSTFRARATGMPPLGLVAVVTGFTSFAIPLATVFAQGGPGCTGYVAPDAIELALPVAGEVASQLTIPPTAALVGLQFHQYALPLEFDTTGTLVAITSSNGLTMTVGAY